MHHQVVENHQSYTCSNQAVKQPGQRFAHHYLPLAGGGDQQCLDRMGLLLFQHQVGDHDKANHDDDIGKSKARTDPKSTGIRHGVDHIVLHLDIDRRAHKMSDFFFNTGLQLCSVFLSHPVHDVPLQDWLSTGFDGLVEICRDAQPELR